MKPDKLLCYNHTSFCSVEFLAKTVHKKQYIKSVVATDHAIETSLLLL